MPDGLDRVAADHMRVRHVETRVPPEPRTHDHLVVPQLPGAVDGRHELVAILDDPLHCPPDRVREPSSGSNVVGRLERTGPPSDDQHPPPGVRGRISARARIRLSVLDPGNAWDMRLLAGGENDVPRVPLPEVAHSRVVPDVQRPREVLQIPHQIVRSGKRPFAVPRERHPVEQRVVVRGKHSMPWKLAEEARRFRPRLGDQVVTPRLVQEAPHLQARRTRTDHQVLHHHAPPGVLYAKHSAKVQLGGYGPSSWIPGCFGQSEGT